MEKSCTRKQKAIVNNKSISYSFYLNKPPIVLLHISVPLPLLSFHFLFFFSLSFTCCFFPCFTLNMAFLPELLAILLLPCFPSPFQLLSIFQLSFCMFFFLDFVPGWSSLLQSNLLCIFFFHVIMQVSALVPHFTN